MAVCMSQLHCSREGAGRIGSIISTASRWEAAQCLDCSGWCLLACRTTCRGQRACRKAEPTSWPLFRGIGWSSELGLHCLSPRLQPHDEGPVLSPAPGGTPTSSATSPLGSVGSWCPKVDVLAAASRSAVCSRSAATSVPGCCPSAASCSVRDLVSGAGPLIGSLLHSAVSEPRGQVSRMGPLLHSAVSETTCQGWV